MISVGEGEGGRVNISSSLRMGERCNIISRGERGLGSGGYRVSGKRLMG